MSVNIEAYQNIITALEKKKVTLVAVSKTKPVEDILELYKLGQLEFGENYVQELIEKEKLLPKEIKWHFIGHLQTNKVKLIAPFVQLIHGVDSLKLLKEINKQAAKCNRIINCLLQIHIAEEETKFGLNDEELKEVLSQFANLEMKHVKICGLMGMASFTENMIKVKNEFEIISNLFKSNPDFSILSIGMSSDYKIAIETGSNMVRIGSLLFGERSKK